MEILFIPLSLIFGCAVRIRGWLFDLKLWPVTRFERAIIGIGNLTTGGTGKTPLVAHLVQQVLAQGGAPAIVSRGYGGLGIGEVIDDPQIYGDEPVWYKRRFPHVPVVVNPRRRLGVAQILRQYKPTHIFLDDGFQHRQLGRDIDIVVVDGLQSSNYYHLLPWGYMREPWDALKRAQWVVVSKFNLASQSEKEWILHKVTPFLAKDRILTLSYFIQGWMHQGRPAKGPAREVILISGVGHPRSVEVLVQDSGFKVKKHLIYADHQAYTSRDVERMLQEAQGGAWPLVTTEKDFVKLCHFENLSPYLWVMQLQVSLSGDLDAFWSELHAVAKKYSR